jgi:hypothetical protein
MELVMDALGNLKPITLEEMDGVKLMDRTDTKFVFNIAQLPVFLNDLKDQYRVLEVNNCRSSRYETIYFDTEDFELYKKHHSGKLNRYKVRCRKYVESELFFFEVKFKNNKGRTIKDRVKRKEFAFKIQDKALELLSKKTPLDAEKLTPNIWVNYSRITLVNNFSKERVTIDTTLHVKNDNKEVAFPKLVIAEVKQEKAQASPFLAAMRRAGIREGSISKYCFGVATLYDNIKKNNFKPKIKTINKIAL